MNFQPSKIPRKIISSPDGFRILRIQDTSHFKDGLPTKAVLMKYYPKYYRRLFIDESFPKYPLLSRIKHIKTIGHFRYDVESYETNKKEKIFKLIKHLFQTKRKSLKSPELLYIPSADFEDYWTPEMEICRFFPKISQLSTWIFESILSGEEIDDFSPRWVQKKILRRYQHFWCALTGLKNLTMFIFTDKIPLLIQRVQTAQRFLASLDTFHLKIYFHPRDFNTETYFQFVLQNQGLLNHVTHITFFGELDFRIYGDQIKFILVSCPKLIGVSFPLFAKSTFIPKDPYQLSFQISYKEEKSIERRHEEDLSIASFRTLQNVTELKLQADNYVSLVKCFHFPPRLEKLTLDSYIPDWYPENPQIMSNFFEKLKRLTRLNSFKIIISKLSNTNEETADFLLPWLKSIPNLETFECEFNLKTDSSFKLDLAVFLEGIAHLQHLKSIKISSASHNRKTKDFLITWKTRNPPPFPKLPLMSIDSWIEPGFNFRWTHFLECIPFDQTNQIHLGKISFSRVSDFQRFLDYLKSVLEGKPLKIDLEIILDVEDLEEILTPFTFPIILPKNITVTLKIYFTMNSSTDERTLQQAQIQNIYRSFKFDIILKGGTGSCFNTEDDVPLMIQNFSRPIYSFNRIQSKPRTKVPFSKSFEVNSFDSLDGSLDNSLDDSPDDSLDDSLDDIINLV